MAWADSVRGWRLSAEIMEAGVSGLRDVRLLFDVKEAAQDVGFHK